MSQTPASNLWRTKPSDVLICLDDLTIVSHGIEYTDNGNQRSTLHLGYKQGGHAYLYGDDADWVYRLLEKGAHDVETA